MREIETIIEALTAYESQHASKERRAEVAAALEWVGAQDVEQGNPYPTDEDARAAVDTISLWLNNRNRVECQYQFLGFCDGLFLGHDPSSAAGLYGGSYAKGYRAAA